jgi:hypothetical protein
MLRAGLTEADVRRVRQEASGYHRRRPDTELEEAGALAGVSATSSARSLRTSRCGSRRPGIPASGGDVVDGLVTLYFLAGTP